MGSDSARKVVRVVAGNSYATPARAWPVHSVREPTLRADPPLYTKIIHGLRTNDSISSPRTAPGPHRHTFARVWVGGWSRVRNPGQRVPTDTPHSSNGGKQTSYQCKKAFLLNMAVNCSLTRLKSCWMAVLLPMKVTLRSNPCGGTSQTDILTLLGIHSTK